MAPLHRKPTQQQYKVTMMITATVTARSREEAEQVATTSPASWDSFSAYATLSPLDIVAPDGR